MRKFISGLLLVAGLVGALALSASAHSHSQKGILTQYQPSGGTAYQNQYYVGGESIGWGIDESYHLDGTSVTYRFDTNVNATLRSSVRRAGNSWNSAAGITFTEVDYDDSSVGFITVDSSLPSGVDGAFQPLAVYSTTGHLTSWRILLRAGSTQSDVAHEMGHAIGLIDLFADSNANKLMYYNAGSSAQTPTEKDVWGAKVITGHHSTHNWAYEFDHMDGSGVNYHKKHCTECGGIGSSIDGCTYPESIGTKPKPRRRKCIYCGMWEGYATTGYDDPVEMK